MNVAQVKCPQCNTPIYSKQKDRLFYCDKCNTLHIRDGGVERMDYEIAEVNQATAGEKVYAPFWRLYCSLVVRSKSVEGGTLFKMTQWLRGNSDTGNIFIYVPAWELDANAFKYFASQFTSAQPRYRTRLNFGGVKRVPAIVNKAEAAELADFVVVTMEAEQPGKLQRLDYSLTVNDSKVVYLPFTVTQQGLLSAL